MIKPLSLLSISAIALLATTQAQSHVLCAPNNPQLLQSHSHNQVYKVPRIQVSQQNQQKHLQAQRARQQKALANQQRITQQRRAQAQARQKQIQAQKNAVIQQQRLAAQRAQAARQKAAVAAAQRAKVQQRQVVSRPVYRPPAPVQTVRYVAPAPVYVAPQPVYHVPAPTRVYTPARSHISVQINSGANRHHHHRSQRNTVRHNPRFNNAQRHYQSRGNGYTAYRYLPRHGGHMNRAGGMNTSHHGKNMRFGSHK